PPHALPILNPRDEPPAADFAAGFETSIETRQLAPRRGIRLAREEPAEDDPVAPEQRPRLQLLRALDDVFRRRIQSRPSAGEVRTAIARGKSSLRSPDERAQSRKPVRCRKAARDER